MPLNTKITVFILAGGFGTRLQESVPNCPKPMAPIAGRPFLEFQINWVLKQLPNANIVLLTHYLANVIDQHFATWPQVSTLYEPDPLGTGGSIKRALQLCADFKDPFLLLNGDTYLEADLNEFIAQSHDPINLVACYQSDCSRFGQLVIEQDRVVKFAEKNPNSGAGFINAGCYYFKDGSPLKLEESDRFSLENLLADFVANQSALGVYCYRGIFIDIGVPSDYERMNLWACSKP